MTRKTAAPAARPWRPAPAETLIGLGVIVVAGAVAWNTTLIPVSPLYAKIGPTVFPAIAAFGLAALGALLLIAGAKGGWQEAEERDVPLDARAVGFVAAGLVANAALIGPLGFTAASVTMFTLIAFGFGSRAPLRDACIGLVVALAAYFGFARTLGVDIGRGLVETFLVDLFGGPAGGV